jgi:spermidine/putrescine transport system substrate-binding protein
MLVPNKADHRSNAESLMNFYYDPVNGAQLAAWNYYFCPVKGAQQQIGRFDKSAVHSPFIFPTPQTLKKAHSFMPLTNKQETLYQRQFNQVMGG